MGGFFDVSLGFTKVIVNNLLNSEIQGPKPALSGIWSVQGPSKTFEEKSQSHSESLSSIWDSIEIFLKSGQFRPLGRSL